MLLNDLGFSERLFAIAIRTCSFKVAMKYLVFYARKRLMRLATVHNCKGLVRSEYNDQETWIENVDHCAALMRSAAFSATPYSVA